MPDGRTSRLWRDLTRSVRPTYGARANAADGVRDAGQGRAEAAADFSARFFADAAARRVEPSSGRPPFANRR